MNRKKFSFIVSVIMFLVLFIMNNDGTYKKEELSLFNDYLENGMLFVYSLKFSPRIVMPINKDIGYEMIWIETKETYEEIEIWNEKIELLKEKIENGIPIYSPKMEEDYLLELIEMDKKCSFYMLGDRKGNQIQIMDLEYVSLEDIYEKTEEVMIYRRFMDVNCADE